MKYILLIIALFAIQCGISRSSLINTKIPTVCKMDLECRYFHREGDKTACVEYSVTCERTLRYDYCKDQKDKKYCKDYMNIR